MRAGPIIRTPDQRLRVFVSSTLQELAPERAAARAAITQLHLVPVLFELGARPHPPRDLYRAYLAQSHIFLGIYWQSYGWVAPGHGHLRARGRVRTVGRPSQARVHQASGARTRPGVGRAARPHTQRQQHLVPTLLVRRRAPRARRERPGRDAHRAVRGRAPGPGNRRRSRRRCAAVARIGPDRSRFRGPGGSLAVGPRRRAPR